MIAIEELAMLRPQDTSTRERKCLNGLWRFALDEAGEGRSGRWFAQPLVGTREMAVPASFNDIAADAAVRDYFGDIWYQTSVWVPRGWQGRRIVLHFESATHRATVWVNDVEVVSHEGGYTPFEADITEHVTPGEQVRITAVVNNTLSFQSIPPGSSRTHLWESARFIGTISSTMRVSTGRSGCTRRIPLTSPM